MSLLFAIEDRLFLCIISGRIASKFIELNAASISISR